MRSVIRGETGIEIVDVDAPRPRSSEVLVRVHAAALNRADLTMAAGAKHGRLGGAGTPLGMEWAGEIVEVGDHVQGFGVGDRVMSSGKAAFSDFAVADHRRVLPLRAAAHTRPQPRCRSHCRRCTTQSRRMAASCVARPS